jgi:hypothetical protein
LGANSRERDNEIAANTRISHRRPPAEMTVGVVFGYTDALRKELIDE